MRPLFVLIAFLALQTGQAQEPVTHIPITDFKQELLQDALLIDVRTPEEYKEGHIANAKNIDWYQDNFLDQFKSVDKDKTIYVYCKLGVRGEKAQKKLDSLGFTRVIHLDGGFEALKKKE